MKALQLVAHGNPGKYEFVDLLDPPPEPNAVVVAVRACGLNHLDLWLERGELPVPLTLPRVPGCEIAGVIEAVGSQAGSWLPGDRVAVQSNLFCGACEFCQRGEDSMCLRGELLGVQRDGGLAEKVIVPARTLVALPAAVEFEQAAALTLAGSTAMHMLTNRVQVRPDNWVLVMGGASGVGSAAIQIAKQLGARVLSLASTAAKRELAARLGAEQVFDSNRADWPAEVRRATAKRGVDIVVEHVGGPFLPRAFQCLARGGSVVTCGATAGREVALDLWPFFVKQHRLVGSYGRNRADIEATLDWTAQGRMAPVIDRVLPLKSALEGIQRLRERQVLGKVVVRMEQANRGLQPAPSSP